MSKIQDLIDLKAMYRNGADIFEARLFPERLDNYDFGLLKQGITIISREETDDDPEIMHGESGNWSYTPECSVTVKFNDTLFKSNYKSGSYGRDEWTEWQEVVPQPKIQYRYVKTTNT